MFVFFSRCGKPLGTLNWKTDRIHLMTSGKFDLEEDMLEKMLAGHYISKNKNIETGECHCNYCFRKWYVNNWVM